MRTLAAIAAEIRQDWLKPSGAAAPYIDGLSRLESPHGAIGADDGERTIKGFLCNAQTWRGPTARRIKAELKRMLQDAGFSLG